ncbi:MAG: zinc metallopeptidase [Deltaproteobacteria bacterium]|nr:zinc metallopeptidase [Deltaproteobacteria bacterium]
MSADRPCIGLIPMGDIPDMTPKVIAAHISGYFDLSAELMPPMKNPAHALNRRLLQYDAGAVIKHMEAMSFGAFDKVVCIMDVDLFLPVFTHIFGEARQGGRVALVSMFRLRENEADTVAPSARTLERVAKVSLHELCHLYGLTHCEDSRCLMHFSGNLADLDRSSFNLCRYCRRFLNDAVQ